MAIREGGVRVVSVGDLLSQDEYNLRIPHYQRPYSWRPETAIQLLEDLREAHHAEPDYVLGAIILHATGPVHHVVDGQQRILTLQMLLRLLRNQPATTAREGSPVGRVWGALRERVRSFDEETRTELAAFVTRQCSVVLVITEELEEAFRIFDSQNHRGKPLDPHDLLKAHHLRHMQSSTTQERVTAVRGWEEASDEDLDRLFRRYLYRIRRWSQGHSAAGFGPETISMFKGVTGDEGPGAAYHFAAQTSEVGPRARFQIDQPILAGQQFFAMTEFLLQDLRDVTAYAYEGAREQFSHQYGWYALTGQIYLAAMLYYLNKFGPAHRDEARERLFRWAYSMRVRNFRITWNAVDHLGRGSWTHDSAFRSIHEGTSWRVINTLRTGEVTTDRDHHATRLISFFEGNGEGDD